ncbi:hypothetical protein S7335_2498 [Synechococcus sp. PCC 7335]|nr:hypothetical protein S7335_2498 [Synechococcus sp. PCC 7335]
MMLEPDVQTVIKKRLVAEFDKPLLLAMSTAEIKVILSLVFASFLKR